MGRTCLSVLDLGDLGQGTLDWTMHRVLDFSKMEPGTAKHSMDRTVRISTRTTRGKGSRYGYH